MTLTEKEWALRKELEEGLHDWLGRAVRIVELAAHPLEMRSSYPIERFQVVLNSGEEIPVIFKRLQPAPERDGDGREVLIYRQLLAGRRFGAPALYGSVHDEARRRYWLFLEDVGNCTLSKQPRDAWCAAVRWLAQLHGTYLGRESELRALQCLGEQQAGSYLWTVGAARRNLERTGNRATLLRFDRLTERAPALAEYLARQARTLIHGDILTDNIVIQPGPCVRPVDWEFASLGVPAWDLARLLDGWGSKRLEFLEIYFAECAHHAAVPLDRHAFGVSLRLCDVFVVLLNLAWSVEDCLQPGFVDDRLETLEALWQGIDEEGAHV
jgi:hypothetical protein